MTQARLLAVSDLHVGYPANREIADGLRPQDPADWLLVAGDVCERVEDLRRTLGVLAQRFARVVWTPGNHELWTHPSDEVTSRGAQRYAHLVEVCRDLGVDTPEDPYPVWEGPGGPVRVAPLFVLYDYSWRTPGTTTEQSLAQARKAGVYARDEFVLHPDPYPTRQAWCHERVALTEPRLAAAADPAVPFVFLTHWPLLRAATRVLLRQEFAQWCGTDLTADWHMRFPTAAAVYGHLHVPRRTVHDGVPFEEVSLGYPRHWRTRGVADYAPREILPRPTDLTPRPGPSVTAQTYLADRPGCAELVASVVAAAGPGTSVEYTTSYVAFRAAGTFARLWLPEAGAKDHSAAGVLWITLDRPVVSDRVVEVTAPAPGRWVHLVRVSGAGDLGGEVAEWLAQAAAVDVRQT